MTPGPITELFEHAWMLGAAVLLAVALPLLLRWSVRRRLVRLARLGQPEVVERLVPAGVRGAGAARAITLGLAGLLAGVALAGPRWGVERTIVRSEGIDLVLALDASLSMMAGDERPSRLERMKQEVRRLRAMSSGDRIGLIAFAGRSYILTPLTVDDGALGLFLDNLDPSVVGQAGSSLARAIRQGTALLLASQSASDKALVVMSDGEAFEPREEVEDAARKARDAGISLVTVGFGTAQGSTIPLREAGRVTQKRDENGEVVVTRYSAELLQAAAQAAEGTFVPSGSEDRAGRVRRALSQLRTERRATQAGRDRSPRFQWFLAPALLLLLLDTWLAERRGRRRRLPAAAVAAPDASRAPRAPTGPAGPVAAAVVLALLAWPQVARAATTEAERAFRDRQYARAAALFRQEMADGDRSIQTVYNLGTALLEADSLPQAIEALERAARAREPEIAFRALFNLGLAHLRMGLAREREDEQQAAASFDAAMDTYKRALRMRSRHMDAKWNYELALHKRKRTGGGGGGGGGEQDDPQPQDSPDQQREEPRPSGSLGPRRAEELLNSAAREEREVQGKRQKQSRPVPPGGKDW